MYGRNGPDLLGQVSVWLALALYLLSALLRRIPLVSALLYWAALIVWGVTLFRIFSKNLPKRRAENQKFSAWWWQLKSRASGAKARRADTQHKYFTCRCGAVCRVPVGKGKIVITCPKCGAKINAKT